MKASPAGKDSPRVFRWFISHLTEYVDRFSLLEDLEEEYQVIRSEKGPLTAGLWYRLQGFQAVKFYFRHTLKWRIIMFLNYLKIAMRNLSKRKLHSFINITGLAIGIACSLLILMYVKDEMSFDRQHANKDRIYRMISHSTIGGTTRKFASTPPAVAPVMTEAIPEIENYARLFQFDGIRIMKEEERFIIDNLFIADPSYFKLFTHEFLAGERESALSDPTSLVLSQDIAERIFGGANPVGRTLIIENFNRAAVKVTAVVENMPAQSHFRADVLLSTELIPHISEGNRGFLDENYFFYGWTYFLMDKKADKTETERKIAEVAKKNWGDLYRQRGAVRRYPLQKLRDIHLRSNYEIELGSPGSIQDIYLFTAVALLVLFIACFNFINLSTARSSYRAREVGLRKVMGAFKDQLVRQFLGESILTSLFGLLLGIGLTVAALPLFNRLAGKSFDAAQLMNPTILLGILAVFLFSGLIAGSFPAFILSSFNPATVIKGKVHTGTGQVTFRKILVVTQFAISIFMIVSLLTILKQLNYMKNKSLGFDRNQLLVVRGGGRQDNALRELLLQNPNIDAVSFSLNVPGQYSGDDTYKPEGKPEGETIRVSAFQVGYDFLDTYGMDIAWGRDFSREYSTDQENAIIINAKAAEMIGWNQDAIGRQMVNISQDNQTFNVIGVVKNFHHKSLKLELNPTVLTLNPENFRYITARVRPEGISGTTAFIETVWKERFPGRDFNYYYIDDDFRGKYESEERVQEIYFYFGILAIFIACLGLYGLASFSVEKRTKEIGVRKILGASVNTIVLLLSWDFIKWVLFANLIGWPIAYWVMRRWLDGFSNRTQLGWEIFAISGLLAFIIFLGTVSAQSIKAASSNPIESLRYE